VMLGSLGRLADHMNGAVTSPGGSGSATTSQRKACDRPSRRTGARRWCISGYPCRTSVSYSCLLS
jgi:hypothetical protein